MNGEPNINSTTGWIEQQRPWVRILLLALAAVAAIFIAGVLVGFGWASYEHGHILPRKPAAWAALALALAISWGLYRLIRALLRPSSTNPMTSFDRRYWRMWFLVGALGVPIGVGLSLATIDQGSPNPFGWVAPGETLQPITAVLLATSFLFACTIGLFLYHRAIDDHEERAMLWGSYIAFYGLVAMLLSHWLLEKGGLVPAVTSGSAMLLVVAAFAIQWAVWAWFKFR